VDQRFIGDGWFLSDGVKLLFVVAGGGFENRSGRCVAASDYVSNSFYLFLTSTRKSHMTFDNSRNDLLYWVISHSVKGLYTGISRAP